MVRNMGGTGSVLRFPLPFETGGWNMTDLNWTTVLSALLTPVVAVLGVFVTYRLGSTAQNKLKLDLFDRRLLVYDAARELISSIMTSGKTSPEQEFKYLSGTRGAVWLFDQSIVEYLD